MTYEGNLTAAEGKMALIVSRFNHLVTEKLLGGAQDALIRHGMKPEQIEVIWVPGAFEIPLLAQKAAESGQYEAVVCLGAIVRGDTPHFDYVAAETAKGIGQAGLKSGIPVIFGVLTTHTMDQALDRAGGKSGNKGWDAAMSALEMVHLMKKWKKN